MAIQQILMARRKSRPPPSSVVRRYRPQYRQLLDALYDLGGEPLVDEVTDWVIEETMAAGELPPPEEVRSHASTILSNHGLTPPDGSPFST